MQFCTFSELTTSIPSTELTEKWAYKGNYKIQKYIISCDQKLNLFKSYIYVNTYVVVYIFRLRIFSN